MIKLLVMDVDGTLTDGKIIIDNNNNEYKNFNVRDGYAIKHILPEIGIIPVIITGKISNIVSKRADDLDIIEVHQNIIDKVDVLKKIIEKFEYKFEEVAYIGDDINDLDAMKIVKISASPSDAHPQVRDISTFKCTLEGGHGCVREFIEYLKEENA